MESSEKRSKARSRTRKVLYAFGLWLAFGLTMRLILGALAAEPANEQFQRTWSRTDQPVQSGLVSRTWMWGPEGFTVAMSEPYDEAPGGERQVQYFDKSRMEDNGYRASDAPWYVTNGLLVVELVSGQLQLGDAGFEQHQPAEGNVAGDQDALDSPSYQTMGLLRDAAPLPDGAPITWRLERDGTVTDDPSTAGYGVTAAYRVTVPGINHQVASPFWAFMNSAGLVYEDGGHLNANLFLNPFYATGYPITEAYWASVKVAGTYQDVLLQCFERRCLTYTPANPEDWQVEAGNVGQHYYTWRYEQIPAESGEAPGDPTEAPPEGTATEPSEGTQPPDDPDASPTATQPPDDPGATPTEEPPADETPVPATEYVNTRSFGGPVNEEPSLNGPDRIEVGPDGYLWAYDGYDRFVRFDGDGKLVDILNVDSDPFPYGGDFAFDPSGNVYMIERLGDSVSVFNRDGTFLRTWDVLGCNIGEVLLEDIAIDSDGRVYVTNGYYHQVLKYAPDGVFIERWGASNCGSGTGEGEFNWPRSIAIDGDDNIYIADSGNGRVQKLNLSGDVLDIWEDANRTFIGFTELAVDQDGKVYAGVFDGQTCGNCLRVFDDSGNLLDTWEDSFTPTNPDWVDFFDDVAIAPNGDVYVSDGYSRNRILKFRADGAFLFEWRDFRRGKLAEMTTAMTADIDGDIYLADTEYDRVHIFGADGVFQRELGERERETYQIEDPADLVTGPDGHVFVLDGSTDRVIEYRDDGVYVTEWGSGTLDYAYGIAMDADGNLYIADAGGYQVHKFNDAGTLLQSWGEEGDGEGQFRRPHGITVHGDRVYVADSFNHRIQVFDREGNYLDGWGNEGGGESQFRAPTGVEVDSDGYVYVADTANHRVQKFTPDGDFLAAFGSQGSGEGQLSSPWRVEVGPDGDVYVLDTGNQRVQVFEPVP